MEFGSLLMEGGWNVCLFVVTHCSVFHTDSR